MSTLSLTHWNDVYRVSPQKYSPTSTDTVDVSQFASLVDEIRDQWPTRVDGSKDGLSLFSGDVFSPSIESSITRGSHMVPVMNMLAPDVSLTGNHDFDFGYPHLTKLIKDTTFPWVLSNIIDETTGRVPDALLEYKILERGGVRVGVIGLVENDWITTVPSWPPHFTYRDMKETGLKLSGLLRDPEGEHKCDLIIALTHSRVPSDIILAKDLNAFSPSFQQKSSTPFHSTHGVDILLGGHDHLYYISKGVTSWTDYDITQPVLGAEKDEGDVLIVKSGTDFRDLSEIKLVLEDTPEGSVRRKVIKEISGKRHSIVPASKSSQKMTDLLKTLLSSVSDTMKAPVCRSTVPLDVRSQFIRTAESSAGNWFADVLRHSYDDRLCISGTEGGGADGVLICAGCLRGDSIYGPGNITVGDIMEILPFQDAIVVLELDGKAIWDALEAGLSTWPAQEGRFPVISGFKVEWDSRKAPGERVQSVSLIREDSEAKYTWLEPVPRSEEGRKYAVVTREYMAEGHDGFTALKGRKYLIEEEAGLMMSSLVRRYLMGSHFVNKMSRLVEEDPQRKLLHGATRDALLREQARRDEDNIPRSDAAAKWKHAANLALEFIKRSKTRAHYTDQVAVCSLEHMSEFGVDPYNGKNARNIGNEKYDTEQSSGIDDEDLLEITPEVDGRFRDEGRS